jgi:HemY protein
MVRIIIYVAIVFALAFGFAWLADRPGALQLTWQGYEYEVSLLVALVAGILLFALLLLLIWLFRAIVSTPRAVGDYFSARRRDRGYRALSRGMIAVGAGDTRIARRAADEAASLLGQEPMTLLLSAQAAQLSGDAALARTAFEALAARPDTRVLGLHGLFVEARRQGEDEAARHFAEEATRTAPKIGWAGEALFEYQAQAGDWLGALRTLGANADAKLIDKATARRLRAVLLTAWALDTEASEPDEARARAQEAHRLAPGLSEAAVVAGRLLARGGDFRRASRVLETAWKAAPHPDIAEAYATVRPGDSVRDRLKRARRLTELRAHHPEGAMALARAAIDAHDWTVAREALEGLVRSQPSERVCLLMAEIEAGEHGDEGRVRAWLARAINAPRDPTWVADGRIFEHWAPISPVTGRIDAFEWKVASEPLSAPRMPQIDAELTATGPGVLKEIEAKTVTAESPRESGTQSAAEPPVATGAEVAAASAASGSEKSGSAPSGDGTGAADLQAVPAEATADAGVTASPPRVPEAAPPAAEPTPADAEPEPTAAAPETETAELEAKQAPEEPAIPRAPDDPGPEPADDPEKPRRNLFG